MCSSSKKLFAKAYQDFGTAGGAGGAAASVAVVDGAVVVHQQHRERLVEVRAELDPLVLSSFEETMEEIGAPIRERGDLARSYLEAMERMHRGDIGKIMAGRCYWNMGGLWNAQLSTSRLWTCCSTMWSPESQVK